MALVGACERAELHVGGACELNSDCDSPLVCRLERCREECHGSRDCPVGLLCIRDDEGLGVCQVDDECTLTSDCPGGLVCAGGRCTNECAGDVDCPAGASCTDIGDGALGCVDRSETPCSLSSSCPPGLRCAPDRRCREPCREDRDCRDGRVCLRSGGGPSMCGLPSPDAGVDAGPDLGVDAGTDAGMPPPPPSYGDLTGGSFHSCAFASGSVRCWGEWIDATTDTLHFAYAAPTAVPLGGVSPVTLASSGSHDCIIAASDGSLRCWGDNHAGQLGQDPAALPFSEAPVPVALGFPVRAVAPGLAHTCVVSESVGEVWCWGDNARSQLGHAGSGPSPARVPLPMAAVDIAARSANTCALLADGSVACWGSNDRGQLGSGGTVGVDSLAPVPVPGLSGVVEVDVGTDFVCVRVEPGGAIRCWGDNSGGQLAIAPAGGLQETPQPVALPRAAAEIENGLAHACARLDDGAVLCWGFNAVDAVGHPTDTFVTAPFEVITGAIEVSTGEQHTCAQTGPSTVYCWGNNLNGQLGSAGPRTPTPTLVPGL